MQFQRVRLASIGYTLPQEVLSSDWIENQLAPLYTRLGLPPGRLELMTGISQRRQWPAGTMPSERSAESGNRALAVGGIPPEKVDLLIHGSVCRDYLEPATASRVHHLLGLGADCHLYDVSNACLGLLNAMVQAAAMIETGQVRAALVVGTEESRYLLETTIQMLNNDSSLTRQDIKLTLASLTIGSGSAALLLAHEDLAPQASPLLSATAFASTEHHELCQSIQDEAVGEQMQPLMHTDSEALMREGIRTGQQTFERFLAQSGWSAGDIDRTICHQVGGAHRTSLLETLQLDEANDFASFPWLGNTGSVALPITLAVAAEQQFLEPDQKLALMGIGSGINCLMLGARWGETPVAGNSELIGHQAEPPPVTSSISR